MPVDYVDATLILHDGDRSEVIFLLPPGEDLARVITEGDAFISVMRNAKICIIASDAIAALGVAPKVDNEDALPTHKQRVTVKLRSGMMLEGELRTVVDGKHLTADHLNGDARTVELRAQDKTYFIVKTHVAYVQES
ncbi:MAG: hypothetical protein M4D80_22150 [Myxococcota bacterium]|nr:hypothetical protein [Deltaproteobacteria bacterium]MDQ3337873.1 hypothetical protein [Myxococcota bacterium]